MKCGKCGWESDWFNPSVGHKPSHFCIDREKEKKANELLDEFGLKPKLSDILSGSSNSSPLQSQVGGDHYRKLAIQPAEYTTRNGLGHLAGDTIAYVTRYKDKGGKQDLEKAIHCLQLLIAIEYPEETK